MARKSEAARRHNHRQGTSRPDARGDDREHGHPGCTDVIPSLKQSPGAARAGASSLRNPAMHRKPGVPQQRADSDVSGIDRLH